MTSSATAGVAPPPEAEAPPRENYDDGNCWHCGDPADGLDWLTGAPVCEGCAALDPEEWETEASADG